MPTVRASQEGRELPRLTDEQLMGLVAQGNRNAFDNVYERYSNQIYNFIKKQVQDQDAAEDIAQETFTRLFKSARSFNPERRLSSYVYKIAVNETRRYYQKLSTAQVLSLNEPVSRDEDSREKGDTIADTSAEEMAQSGLTTGYLQGLIDRLPPEQKMVMLLKVYQDLTFEQIAQIMDKPLSTVLSRMRYAVQKLRRWMEEQGVKEDELRRD